MKILLFMDSSEEGLKKADEELLGFLEERGQNVIAFTAGVRPKDFSPEKTPARLKYAFFHESLQNYHLPGLSARPEGRSGKRAAGSDCFHRLP